jgi:sugar O-acyltransferase (sialic acid O-acetyltransferase NeuD family)
MNNLHLLGSGGHATSIETICIENNNLISNVITKNPYSNHQLVQNYNEITEDEAIQLISPMCDILINGLGFMPKTNIRCNIFKKYKDLGYKFLSIIAKSAQIEPSATLNEGVQVMNKVCINAKSYIGSNTIINTASTIEHHNIIGSNCHIAPGAIICGGCNIGNNVFVGANATVLQNSIIPDYTVISAGSVYNQRKIL